MLNSGSSDGGDGDEFYIYTTTNGTMMNETMMNYTMAYSQVILAEELEGESGSDFEGDNNKKIFVIIIVLNSFCSQWLTIIIKV